MKQQDKTHMHSIRFPAAQYERIKELAERDHRSFNSEVIYLIEQGMARAELDKGNKDCKDE